MVYYDTHVHSHRSFVGAPDMTLGNIAGKAAEIGIDRIALTDHLMKPQDLDGLRETGRDIREYNNRLSQGQPKILFGVEVCEVASDGKTLLTRQIADDLGFDVIIGGVHETHSSANSTLSDIVAEQCRHHMIMMENPLVEILVHPWWLDKGEFERLGFPWPEDMSFIPRERTAELARASAKTRTYLEISTMSGLCNKDTSERFRGDLWEYYRVLNENGALFAIGTDAHELSDLKTFPLAKQLIEEIGIKESRFYSYGD